MKHLFALLLLLPASLAAQTHPCDAAPTAISVTGGATLSLLFCAKPVDTLVRVDVLLDTATVPSAQFTETQAVQLVPPNAAGYAHYKGPLGVIPAGSHTIRIQAVNVDTDGAEQRSDLSDALTFTVLAPKPRPGKPKVTGVSK